MNKKRVVINFIDWDKSSKQIATSGEITGNVGQQIDYRSQDQIKELENKGYVLEKILILRV